MNERVRGAPVGTGEEGWRWWKERCTCKQASAIKGTHNEMREGRAGSGGMFILPPRRTGSHGESPPPPGAVPLGSGIRCSDFGAVNPGGGWKLREPPSWGQCKTLGLAGDAGLQRLAGLYLHAGPAGNGWGADDREEAPLQFEGSIICPLSGLYVLFCFCYIYKIKKQIFF